MSTRRKGLLLAAAMRRQAPSMARDVEDDLAVEMASELEREGTCVRVVPAIPAQRAIDVSWAAKRAGRLIGERVRTSVVELPSARSEVAVVAVVEPRRPNTVVEQRRPGTVVEQRRPSS